MSLLVKRVDFQMPTSVATTVIQVRGVGFQGAAVFFWWNGRDGTSDAAGEVSIRGGFGFAVGTAARRCIAYSSLHAGADGEADCYGSEEACIATVLPGTGDPSTVEGAADFNGWVADGFDIIIDDAFATAFRVHALVIGGSDVTNVAVGTFDGLAAPGDLDVDLGFQPDLLCAMTSAPDLETVNTNGAWSLGFAVSAAEQFAYNGFISDNAATTSTWQYMRRGDLISEDEASTRAQLAAFLPDGFRLTYPEAAVAYKTFYLAIKGGRFGIVGFNTSTVSTTSIPVTGLNFPPKAALFVSGNQAEHSESSATQQQALSIGVATGTAAGEQAAVHFQDKDSAATSDCFTSLDYDQVYLNASVVATQALEGWGRVTSLDADGFTFVQTDGDPVASFVAVLCFGDVVPGALDDEAGFIYRGAPIRFINDDNFEVGAFLESAQASFGDTVDLALLRAVGSSLTKVSVSSVPHASVSGRAPYWTRY